MELEGISRGRFRQRGDTDVLRRAGESLEEEGVRILASQLLSAGCSRLNRK